MKTCTNCQKDNRDQARFCRHCGERLAAVETAVQSSSTAPASRPSSHRDKLDRLAEFLYEKETITGDEFMKILKGGDAQ